MCVGGELGRGKCVGDWRNQGGEGSVDGSQSGGRRRRRGIEALVVRFGTSVNDLPKSIDWNEWNTNQLLVQMYYNSVVVNAQLQICLCEAAQLVPFPFIESISD
ncbi:hypothetical protein AVEN_80462-1 [Araneus ventricosus]|uniref:Uncharacterized protein n=1 Tax=Araneus ventricosus TaxID=182803 RepID=A0A4Y2H9R2_ARAVE|nr:hypothetical protein AVEN_80462-1 [Araneus ventricosus]